MLNNDSNLIRFDRDGLELVINESTGECFAGIRATARMCGVEHTTISRFAGGAGWKPERAEIQTNGGVQGGARLLNEEQIHQCLAKYNPALLLQCSGAGLRVYLHRLAGYEVHMKPASQLPTPKELAYMLIAAEDAREKAEAEAKALTARIEADEPATTLGKIIESSNSRNIRIGDFAKILGDVGQNRYFDELRECGIIMAMSTLPYQRYISAGYFRVSEVQGNGAASNRWFPVTLITPKGQTYLAKRHKKYLASIATERVIEAQVEALV
jgi:phage antirepressor YoqD-like protein